MKTGRKLFSIFKHVLFLIAFLLSLFGKRFNTFLLMIFRNTPGFLGLSIRYVLLKNIVEYIGDNVAIHQNVYLKQPQKLRIGNNVSIHPMVYIESGGGVEIGNNVSIAHNVSILSINHTYDDFSLPIKYNELKYDKILIKEDVWIGCGARILSGVVIEDRVIIAAGAVVNKSINKNSLVGGVPAKLIKTI